MASLSRQALWILTPLAALTLGLLAARWLSGRYGPPLLVTPAAFEIGDVAEGRTLTATVTLKNRGGMPLEITRADRSCDCTDLKLPGVLAPGTSAPLTLTLDTRGQRTGPLGKSIVLHLKGHPKDPVTIPLKGSIREEIRVTPKVQNLGALPCRARHPVALTLTRVDGRPLRVTKIEPLQGLALTASNPRPETVALAGVFTAPDAPGDFQETLTLHTDDAALPKVTARLDFSVKAVYALTPKFAHFGLTRERAPKEIRVEIAGPKARLRLLSVPATLTARLEGETVVIARRPDAPARLVSEVRIETDNPSQPQIPIPVYSFFSR